MEKRLPGRPDWAIVFDFGGVLIEWDPRYLYRKLFNGSEAAMEAFLAEVGFAEWNHLQDAGRPFSEGVEELCSRFPKYCDLIRAYKMRWIESIGGVIQPSVEVLRQLKDAGYPLYGLSNWSAETFPLVRPRLEFVDWFQEVVLSGDVGAAKPDPHIFHVLLEKIGRPAQECILIDDVARNIEAAQRIGFQTIQYQSPGQLSTALAGFGIQVE